MTPEQEEKLKEFRKQLQDAGYKERLDDASLLRFLRARKFDVHKAYLMFTECEQWRKDFGVDDLVQNFKFEEKPLVTTYYPQYYHKTDKVRPSLSTILSDFCGADAYELGWATCLY